MNIRKATWWRFDQPVSLPFITCIADQHPEAVDGQPPPAPPPPRVNRECGPRLTDAYIRKVLGKPEPPGPDQAQFDATLRRIEREGF